MLSNWFNHLLNMESNNSTEEVIKNAARKVFTLKGLDGARMQDIADEANVNKGLLNYYFRSKEKLFMIIFDEAFNALFSETSQILNSENSLQEKILLIIKNDSLTILKNPFLPMFVMNELAKNQHLIEEKINNSPVKLIIRNFSKQVESEVKKGTIRNVNGEELFINMTSMIMFPFIGKNLFQTLFNRNDKSFEALIIKRQVEVAEFILASIRK
jgi:TetR/AcrR family transcriptional regulator